MKKSIILSLFVMLFMSCGKEKDSWPESTLLKEVSKSTDIFKLHELKMRLDLPYPFQHYILRLESGHDIYARARKVPDNIGVGCRVDKYWVYRAVPNEVYEIRTSCGSFKPDPLADTRMPSATDYGYFETLGSVIDYLCNAGDGVLTDVLYFITENGDEYEIDFSYIVSRAHTKSNAGDIVSMLSEVLGVDVSTRGLLVSEEKSATVRDAFSMGVRYSIPFVGLDSFFLEIENNNVIYSKERKNKNFKADDNIVYRTYVLFPNEIYSIHKL